MTESIPQPKDVLCDVGGILIEVQWPYVAQLLGSESSADPHQVTERLRLLTPQLDLGKMTVADLCDSLVENLGLSISRQRFLDIVLHKSQHFLKHNFDFLLSLKSRKSVRLVAVSNVCDEISLAQREMFPLDRLFSRYVRSCDVGYLKPDKRFFLEALKQLHSTPQACLLIDDLRDSITSAEGLGIQGVWIPTPDTLASSVSSQFSPPRAGGDDSKP